MQLYNKLSAKERENLIEQAGEERLTLSFYQYAKIRNPTLFRDYLFIHWDELNVLGRIYIAKEGINAQLSLPALNFDAFKTHLDSIEFLNEVRLNIAIKQNNKSFLKSISGTPKPQEVWTILTLISIICRAPTLGENKE